MFKHYKPSRAKRIQFAMEMDSIREFCKKTIYKQVKITIAITLP